METEYLPKKMMDLQAYRTNADIQTMSKVPILVSILIQFYVVLIYISTEKGRL